MEGVQDGATWTRTALAPGLIRDNLLGTDGQKTICSVFNVGGSAVVYCDDCLTSLRCDTVEKAADAVYDHHHNMVAKNSPVLHSTTALQCRSELRKAFQKQFAKERGDRLGSNVESRVPIFPKPWVQGILGAHMREDGITMVGYCVGCSLQRLPKRLCHCAPELKVQIQRVSLGPGRAPIYMTDDQGVLELQGRVLGEAAASSSSSSSSLRSPQHYQPPPPPLAPNSSWTPVQPAGPTGRFSNVAPLPFALNMTSPTPAVMLEAVVTEASDGPLLQSPVPDHVLARVGGTSVALIVPGAEELEERLRNPPLDKRELRTRIFPPESKRRC